MIMQFYFYGDNGIEVHLFVINQFCEDEVEAIQWAELIIENQCDALETIWGCEFVGQVETNPK